MKKEQSFNRKYTDLLKDEKFLQWRIFPDSDTDTFWEALVQDTPGLKDEIALADQYLKKHTFNKSVISSTDKQLLLCEIKQSLNRHKQRHTVKLWIKYAVTACIALGIALSFFFRQNTHTEQISESIVGNLLESEDIRLIASNETKSFKENISLKIDVDGVVEIQEDNQRKADMQIAQNTMNKLIVPYGKRSSIELSDGTRIWLNSGSVLEFPVQFAADSREIKLLSGEIYLEVTPDKNKPFRVNTFDFAVQVLGTKFNISAYDNYPQSVVLLEGSVDVKSKSESIMRLAPNEQAVYASNGRFRKEAINATDAISWIEGYLVLEETSVLEALKSIERYYNLSFNFEHAPNLQHITCKGKLHLSDNIDNVMHSIAILSSSTYKRDNNTIYIKANTPKTYPPMEEQ